MAARSTASFHSRSCFRSGLHGCSTCARLATGAAVVVLLYGPWIAYGRTVDPNDGRLLKAHLTGGDPNSPEPFGRMLLRSYQEVSAGHWVRERLRNLERQFRDPVVDLLIVRIARGVRDARLQGVPLPEPGPGLATDKFRFDLVSLGAALRVDQRETALRALGALNLAWPLMLLLVFRRQGLDPPLVFLLVLNMLTSVWWSIAQFHGASTVITHSSFAMILIAFVSAAVILLRVSDHAGAYRLRGEHRARRADLGRARARAVLVAAVQFRRVRRRRGGCRRDCDVGPCVAAAGAERLTTSQNRSVMSRLQPVHSKSGAYTPQAAQLPKTFLLPSTRWISNDSAPLQLGTCSRRAAFKVLQRGHIA